MPEALQRRGAMIDAAMAVAMFVFAMLSLISLPDFGGVRPLDWLGVALIAAQTLSLAWRRRYPVTILVVAVGAFVVDRGLNYPSSWAVFGIAFALYTIGAELGAGRSMIIGAIAIAVIVGWTAVGVFTASLPAPLILTVFGFVTFPYVLGREAHRREQRVIELEARALRAEFDRERRAEEAVREEQTRIARELHDVVAHEVTVMTIQAAAANRVFETSPEEASAAMTTVEEAGHRALTEMRRLLGLLRSGGDGDLDPQPGLEDLDTLISQLGDAGLDVALTVEGRPRPIPVGVDVNAFRIIQESLTNTVKHGGPGARSSVVVRYGEQELSITVSDDGRGAAVGLSGNGSGQGIVGMRERVVMLDGTLEAGPRPGGGYRVLGRIPLEGM